MRAALKAVDLLGQWYSMVPDKPKAKFDAQFTLVFERAARAFAKSDMNGFDFRLMFWLVHGDHKLDFVSWREVSQDEVAVALEVSQPTVSRSLQRLAAMGVVERQNRGGGAAGRKVKARWRLNPMFFWRGKAEQYWPAVRERKATKQQRASALREAEAQLLLEAGGERPASMSALGSDPAGEKR